jgi:ferric-dicitrate binding protein FerR (iron transport regulator)
MNKKVKIEELFLRLMEGESLDSDELNRLRSWIAAHPDQAEDYREYLEIWNLFDVEREVNESVVDHQWEKFRRKMRVKESRLPVINGNWLKYAAVLVMGMLISSLFFMWKPQEKTARQIVEVPYGAKSTIQLTDGTEVVLNAGSTLTYEGSFGKNSREVTLVGEAFFRVAKDKKRPFTVHTQDMSVTAYGTIFNVKAYPGEEMTEATLIEGSIGIKLNDHRSGRKKEIFLKPNEQLVYSKSGKGNGKGRLLIVKNIQTDLYTAWVDDNIQVRSKTLKELAVQLERKYNVNIYIMDKELEQKRFTGLLKNETIEQILQILKLSAHIDYKIDNRDIWLYQEKKLNN